MAIAGGRTRTTIFLENRKLKMHEKIPGMLERLDPLVDKIAELRSKLILLVGPPGSGKTALLAELAHRRGAKVMNVGAALGRRLVALSQRERPLRANALLRELTEEYARGDLLLLDNVELLFDWTLQLDPLDLLKHLAHARRVVAAWPGELRDGRLYYAEMGHPEFRNYGIDGLVPYDVEIGEVKGKACATEI